MCIGCHYIFKRSTQVIDYPEGAYVSLNNYADRIGRQKSMLCSVYSSPKTIRFFAQLLKLDKK